MIEVMHKAGQHQQAKLLAAKPSAHRQHPSRHDDMREMTSMMIDVATGIAGRGRYQAPHCRCPHRSSGPAITLQSRPTADIFKITT
ncbi:MAG: hypothetical protein VW989_06450 [Rhodobiaceae bacterium]